MTPIDPMPERMARPTITDEEVALLPLADGRADLLEAIMSTPALDHAAPATRRTPPGWLVASAAAAAVAAIAFGTTLGGEAPGPDRVPSADRSGPQRVVGAPEFRAAPVAPVVPEVPGGRYVGVEVAEWDVRALYEDGYGLTIAWEQGEQWLEVVRYPADQHANYFADRDRDMAGQQTSLFGRDATTWAYSPDDHATMTDPADGFFFEVRAAGMPLAAYEDLIGSLVQTDEAGFYAGLPEGTVTPANRDQAIGELLRGVEAPEGFTAEAVDLEGFNDAYQAGAAVAGSVSCAWLDLHAGGSAPEQQQAVDALAGSRDWPVLLAMAPEGAYPDAIWQIADDLRAGRPIEEIRQGIC